MTTRPTSDPFSNLFAELPKYVGESPTSAEDAARDKKAQKRAQRARRRPTASSAEMSPIREEKVYPEREGEEVACFFSSFVVFSLLLRLVHQVPLAAWMDLLFQLQQDMS